MGTHAVATDDCQDPENTKVLPNKTVERNQLNRQKHYFEKKKPVYTLLQSFN